MLGVEADSLLPNGQRDRSDLARQREPRHLWPDSSQVFWDAFYIEFTRRFHRSMSSSKLFLVSCSKERFVVVSEAARIVPLH